MASGGLRQVALADAGTQSRGSLGSGLRGLGASLSALWHKASYRRRLAINATAFLGVFATVAQIFLWITGADSFGGVWLVAPLIAIGLAVVVWRSLPPTRLHMRHASYSASFELVSADLFDFVDGPIVVPVNRHFDFSPEWVADESLIAQLIKERHAGDPAAVRQAISDAGVGAAEAPVGTAVRVSSPNGESILLAVSQRHEQQRSTVLVNDIANAHARLWEAARATNSTTLTTPVIGSGLARAQLGPMPLLMLLLTSYITAAMEVPVCHLRVVFPGRLELSSAIDLCREYGEALGFTT